MTEWRQNSANRTPMIRAWLECPPPAVRESARIVRSCPERRCLTWVFGSIVSEADGHLAEHLLHHE